MPGTPDMPGGSDLAAGPVPLVWEHEIDQIAPGGFLGEREATPEERLALAKVLEILSVGSLRVAYRLRRGADEGYRFKGKLTADVVQACIVTLAPVLDTVSAEFSVEFRPADEVRSAEAGAINLDDDTEIEPIEGKVLSVGRVVFEELAAALNPYPRRLGAVYERDRKSVV